MAGLDVGLELLGLHGLFVGRNHVRVWLYNLRRPRGDARPWKSSEATSYGGAIRIRFEGFDQRV